MGDEFIYSADNGKLFLARLNSNLTEKTEKSINRKTAQEIAEKYIADNCDANELKLSLQAQNSEGYFFEYSKFILEYKTNAAFEIRIGFDGSIAYIRNNIDVLDGVEINIDEEWVEEMKESCISRYKDEEVSITRIYISVENGKAYLIIGISSGLEIASEIK